GRVTTISTSADAKSRVYAVEVMIPNPKDLLKSGMIATLAVGGEDFPQPVLGVPLEAVIRDPRQPSRFAVLVTNTEGENTKAHLRPVELGDAYGNMVAIHRGLSVNEQVITTGASLIKDGDSVRILQ